MSLKLKSLGTASASVTSGLAITGGTNATPIVATITAGHGLKNGDRIHISGVTGNTGMNGEWTLEFASATTAKLIGSKGNGTYGGTPVVNAIMDVTPFLARHSAIAIIEEGSTPVSAGTIDIEGHPGDESSAGVLDTSKWERASVMADAALTPSAVAGAAVEVKLFKYMRVAVKSALTGTCSVKLLA